MKTRFSIFGKRFSNNPYFYPFPFSPTAHTDLMLAAAVRSTSRRKSTRCFATEINGKGSTAVIFGGFGFTERAMAKHAALYETHNFDTVGILSPIIDLTTPAIAEKKALEMAKQIVDMNQPTVCHFISGSIWTGLYVFDYLDQVGGIGWRDEHVKAICFDSCPPKSDIYAFGGFLAYRFKNPALKNLTAPFFEPYRRWRGINTAWEEENRSKMFGKTSTIPRGAHQLHIHGKTDPVLDAKYLKSFIDDCRQHKESPNISVVEATFEKSKHSMAVVEHPQDYKSLHIAELLGKVEMWKGHGTIVAPTGSDFKLD